MFEVEASNIKVELNLAKGTGTNEATPVVDFAVDNPSERLALFDSDDADTVGMITVGELRALAGQTSGKEYSSTVGELYAAAALDTDTVVLDDVVRTS